MGLSLVFVLDKSGGGVASVRRLSRMFRILRVNLATEGAKRM